MEEINDFFILVEKKLDLKVDFKEYLDSKKTSYNYTGYNGYNSQYRNPNCFDGVRFSRGMCPPMDDRRILFYEFSDTQRLPRRFDKVSEFMKWAKECKLYVTDYTKEQLETHPVNYVSCYKGMTTVIVRDSWEALDKSLRDNAKYQEFNSYDPKSYEDDDEDYRYSEYWD